MSCPSKKTDADRERLIRAEWGGLEEGQAGELTGDIAFLLRRLAERDERIYRLRCGLEWIIVNVDHGKRPKDELPRADEIVDKNFTDGLKSEEYLERLRNGDL